MKQSGWFVALNWIGLVTQQYNHATMCIIKVRISHMNAKVNNNSYINILKRVFLQNEKRIKVSKRDRG